MNISGFELRRVAMPLVSPFRTSFGTQTTRDLLLVRAVTEDAEGWGECSTLPGPVYSAEYADGAMDVMRRFLIPALLNAELRDATGVAAALHAFKGHQMAKSAIETAILDAELRAEGRSFARELGSTRSRVPCGVSVGIMPSISALLDAVGEYLDAGYVRIKLKIEPGWDIDPIRAVREAFGDDVPLQVDANTAYSLSDTRHLAKLDDYGLLLIEQPLDEDDLLGHAELARAIRTPICLDESITSASTAAAAIRMGAAEIINIKPCRVGGYLEARRIHDLALAHGVGVWCGGMLESGIGRAANIALASLPGFTLPGDISASDRFYEVDLTPPFVMRDGHLDVPLSPGIGVEPLPDILKAMTTATEWVHA